MKTLRQLRRNFDHGVHPAHLKKQTEDLSIQRVPFVSHYVMPLGQHIGVPCRPVVKAGEQVGRGQLIAEPGGFVSTALHSPVTGTIREIGEFRGIDGQFSPAIQIEADPYATQQLESAASTDWMSLSLRGVHRPGTAGGNRRYGRGRFSIPCEVLGPGWCKESAIC